MSVYRTIGPLVHSNTVVYRGIPISLIFDPKHTLLVLISLSEAVLTCTHIVCFELE